MSNTSLGKVMVQVLETGERKTLDEEQQNNFYKSFYEHTSPEIEKIREEQRKRFDESRNLTLA